VAGLRRGGDQESGGGGINKKLVWAGGIFAVALGVYFWTRPPENLAVEAAKGRVFMCAETGETFRHELQPGEVEPVYSPHSKQNTGWLAEACYWTPDEQGGWKAKLEPTYVILKSRMDPNSTEVTKCPDCGREVRGHNPMPPREMMDAARAEAGG